MGEFKTKKTTYSVVFRAMFGWIQAYILEVIIRYYKYNLMIIGYMEKTRFFWEYPVILYIWEKTRFLYFNPKKSGLMTPYVL